MSKSTAASRPSDRPGGEATDGTDHSEGVETDADTVVVTAESPDDGIDGVDVSFPDDVDADEATAIVVAIREHLRAEADSSGADPDDPTNPRWKAAARLRGGDHRAGASWKVPDDPWLAAGRLR